jgi:DNA-binding phage protein
MMAAERTIWMCNSVPKAIVGPHMQSLDSYSIEGIFYQCNMEKSIEHLQKLLKKSLPHSVVAVDAPERGDGNWWLDVSMGKKRHTLEYRPGKGFGLFHGAAGYGEGPAEIYRTPERAAKRLAQLMAATNGNAIHLGLKDVRELYGYSQVTLAKRAGVKQPAISRFEKRGEVKLSTLAATIKALGGTLEVRAHFSDADFPISLSSTKG